MREQKEGKGREEQTNQQRIKEEGWSTKPRGSSPQEKPWFLRLWVNSQGS